MPSPPATRRLESLLEERFLIVDVMSGAVADRAALVAALDDCARCRPAAPSRTPRRRACTGC